MSNSNSNSNSKPKPNSNSKPKPNSNSNSKQNLTIETSNNQLKKKFKSKISPKKKKNLKNTVLSPTSVLSPLEKFNSKISPKINVKNFRNKRNYKNFQNESKRNYNNFLNQIKNKVSSSYKKYSDLDNLKDKDEDLVFKGLFNDLIDTFQFDDKELNIIEFGEESTNNNKKKLLTDLYDKSMIGKILVTQKKKKDIGIEEFIINDKYNITYSTFLNHLNNLKPLDKYKRKMKNLTERRKKNINRKSKEYITLKEYLDSSNATADIDDIFKIIQQRVWEKVYQDILVRGTTEKLCVPHNMHIEISPELSDMKKVINTNIIYAGYPLKKNNLTYKNITEQSKYLDYGMIENIHATFGVFLYIQINLLRNKTITFLFPDPKYTKYKLKLKLKLKTLNYLLSLSDPKHLLSKINNLGIKSDQFNEKTKEKFNFLEKQYNDLNQINKKYGHQCNYIFNDFKNDQVFTDFIELRKNIFKLMLESIAFSINLINNYGKITYTNPIIKNNNNSDITTDNIQKLYDDYEKRYQINDKYTDDSLDNLQKDFSQELYYTRGKQDERNKLYLTIIEEISPNKELDKPYYSDKKYINIPNEWINIKKKDKLIQIFRYDMKFYPHVTIKYVLDTCLKDKEKRMKKEYSNGIFIPLNVHTHSTKSDGISKISENKKTTNHVNRILKAPNHANILIFDTRNNQEIKVYIFDMNYTQPSYIKKNIDKYLKIVENKVKEEGKGNYKFHRNNNNDDDDICTLIDGNFMNLPDKTSIHSEFGFVEHGICGAISQFIAILWGRYGHLFKDFPEMVGYFSKMIEAKRNKKDPENWKLFTQGILTMMYYLNQLLSQNQIINNYVQVSILDEINKLRNYKLDLNITKKNTKKITDLFNEYNKIDYILRDNEANYELTLTYELVGNPDPEKRKEASKNAKKILNERVKIKKKIKEIEDEFKKIDIENIDFGALEEIEDKFKETDIDEPGHPLLEKLKKSLGIDEPIDLSLNKILKKNGGKVKKSRKIKKGGKVKKSKKVSKKVRRHQGIAQKGKQKGKLKKGYKYTGKRLKSGLAEIIKIKK